MDMDDVDVDGDDDDILEHMKPRIWFEFVCETLGWMWMDGWIGWIDVHMYIVDFLSFLHVNVVVIRCHCSLKFISKLITLFCIYNDYFSCLLRVWAIWAMHHDASRSCCTVAILVLELHSQCSLSNTTTFFK